MVEESIEKAEEIYNKAQDRILAAAEEKIEKVLPCFTFSHRELVFTEYGPEFSCRFSYTQASMQVSVDAGVYLRENEIREILGEDFETFDTFCRHFDLYSNAHLLTCANIESPVYRAAWSDRENFAETQWGRKQAALQQERVAFDARMLYKAEGAFPSSEWLQSPEYLLNSFGLDGENGTASG